jgi:hypothetical protein
MQKPDMVGLRFNPEWDRSMQKLSDTIDKKFGDANRKSYGPALRAVSMHDCADLRHTYEMLELGEIKKAFDVINKADSAVRDDIPSWLWKLMLKYSKE